MQCEDGRSEERKEYDRRLNELQDVCYFSLLLSVFYGLLNRIAHNSNWKLNGVFACNWKRWVCVCFYVAKRNIETHCLGERGIRKSVSGIEGKDQK